MYVINAKKISIYIHYDFHPIYLEITNFQNNFLSAKNLLYELLSFTYDITNFHNALISMQTLKTRLKYAHLKIALIYERKVINTLAIVGIFRKPKHNAQRLR